MVSAPAVRPASAEARETTSAQAAGPATAMPGIGIDLLYLDELDALLQRPWVLSYLYAEAELRHADTLTGGRRRDFLAGRFAAKEAVLKVLDCGLFGEVLPRHIEVHRTASGRPDVQLAGSARHRSNTLGLAGITVTLTHKRDVVLALALGLPKRSLTP
ncbi:holo-ACP synthase [Streptomyces sp. NBC_01089]|uniref:holo-ACP synthase n=1 Tax=Streptomyces sp. NBC_01089 TaxID=2903747 RepID=UPI00386677F5|nr:4'-phosphopantetheinyl transferase superfamily protein [Streptomyces sp. NBC_01089]WSU46364.1 4'-phosphopantetheinyl transferase superfamily protein [Streptomyces sp. NBC_01089]